jgi:hypothetical protein
MKMTEVIASGMGPGKSEDLQSSVAVEEKNPDPKEAGKG